MTNDDWISVDDEMPEYEGMYLCHFSDGDIETFIFDKTVDSDFWTVVGGIYDGSVYVTHWMELPPPPKGVN